jgi:hypothetical protein
MKCPKCGAEIPASLKFCNECGAKIEQVALFKDSEPESTESYKCGECGKIIPSNSVFCPECHAYQKNKFKPTSDTEKSSDKKPVYRNSHFYIALLIVLILSAVVVTAISQVSQTKSQETETTISTPSKMVSYTLSYVDYEIPDDWETDEADDGKHNYHYDSTGDLFYVSCSDIDVDEKLFNEELMDSVIESNEETCELYSQKSKEIIEIDGHKTLHTTFTYIKDDEDTFCSSYALMIKKQLYLITFRNKGLTQSTIFDECEEKIMNSITTNSSGYENKTEAPTKKPTEPETEPPTEKPTEFEDTLTELYSDSDIAIYYSDTEKYPYSDDEADVHFYVKNKMDKSITIQADTVILDGRSYNQVVCSDPISAHSEGMIEVSIDNCKNFNPSTVGADLRYFDSDNFGSTVKMNLISKKVK